MDLVIKLDIEAAITAALQPERLAPILDKHITAAVTSAIDQATGYQSEFRKGLAAQLTAALPHGLGLDDVAKFQHVLNSAVQTAVHGLHSDAVNTALKKVVDQVLPEVPAVLKVSELLAMARDTFTHGGSSAFYAYLNVSGHDSKSGWLYLDDDERPGSTRSYGHTRFDRDGNKYDAKYCLAYSSSGDVYALKVHGQHVTPGSRPDVISKLDGALMSLYVGRTRIEVDMDDDDVESASAEQDPS